FLFVCSPMNSLDSITSSSCRPTSVICLDCAQIDRNSSPYTAIDLQRIHRTQHATSDYPYLCPAPFCGHVYLSSGSRSSHVQTAHRETGGTRRKRKAEVIAGVRRAA